MGISQPVQTTYPYSNSLTASGTLAAAVAGKKIVANISGQMYCVTTGGGNSGSVSVTITGTQNGGTVTFGYNLATLAEYQDLITPFTLPPNLEFDTNSAVTATIATTNGGATVSIGYYLK
jgi:hypothetical protein